ncbi:MAG: hypothetical protein WAT19_15725 [Ferruginibacter sp.]
MNSSPETPFEFSPQLDTAYLESLFGDDLSSIKEIFNSFLIDTKEGYNDVQTAYKEENLKLLRQKIHKIKPTFGFVGLTTLTHNCETVIAACDASAGITEVRAVSDDLFKQIEDSFILIENEVKRLDEYGA